MSGAKLKWISEYNDAAFGSWIVASPEEHGRFVYDGKDFLLMVYGFDNKTIWQGHVQQRDDVQDSIFQFLAK